jgi:hypothetical protein
VTANEFGLFGAGRGVEADGSERLLKFFIRRQADEREEKGEWERSEVWL